MLDKEKDLLIKNNRTENLELFLEAFCNAQQDFKTVIKNKEVKGKLTYQYADFSSYIEMTRPILSKNKLVIFQTHNSNSSKDFIIETYLTHISGQGISSVMIIKPEWFTPLEQAYPLKIMQSIGCANTYFRRQAYISILGLAAEDDDGMDGDEKVKIYTKEDPNIRERIQKLKELCIEHSIDVKAFTSFYNIQSKVPHTLDGVIENFVSMKTDFENKKIA